MSKWQQVRLGDVSASCLGKMLDQHKNKGELQPYLANIDVRWGEFDLEHLGVMKFEAHEQDRYGLQYGDLVICEGGEPGRCAIWKNQIPNMKIQKALHRLRTDKNILDNRFLFYWFLLAGKTGELEQYFTGATIKHMPGQKLKEVKIPLPPIDVQRKIADVLSAYDDLIENNRKQIKLLEETAQRLYKEWFIDLRFPGHETTPIVNGIPKGWKLTNLGTLGAFVRGKTITKDQTCSGNIPVVAGGLTPAYYHNAHNTDVPVITVSGSGANAGFSNMYFQKIWASDCSYLEKSKTQGFFFVYCFLKSNQEMLDNLQKGSAQPHVYAKDINAIAFYKPQDDVLQNFEYKTSPLFEQIANLQTSIKKATETRDRLLPKLMTGELEVE